MIFGQKFPKPANVSQVVLSDLGNWQHTQLDKHNILCLWIKCMPSMNHHIRKNTCCNHFIKLASLYMVINQCWWLVLCTNPTFSKSLKWSTVPTLIAQYSQCSLYLHVSARLLFPVINLILVMVKQLGTKVLCVHKKLRMWTEATNHEI